MGSRQWINRSHDVKFRKILKFYSKDTIVEVAGGKTILSTGFEDVDLKLDEENGGSEITLKSVLYVSELKANLLSTSLAAEKGLKIIFEENYLKLIAPDGKLVAESIKYKGLYYIKEKHYEEWGKDDIFSHPVANKTISKQNQLWHRRFAHMNVSSVNKMLNNDNNVFLSDETDEID
ncbi:hypothetical protein JTB14_018803 [Gonioctena quinquepunctata]|nr:hypothetical protein JTB14_018803 [Gonioctena quinquepunctata]